MECRVVSRYIFTLGCERTFCTPALVQAAGMDDDPQTLWSSAQEKLERGEIDEALESLKRLEALLAIADKESSLLISGTGDVIEPEHGLIAIGSGGPFAQAAALALIKHSELNAEEITRQALGIAADICIYTNSNLTIETLDIT